MQRPRTQFGIVAILAIISASIYLAVSRAESGFGFPLDDAWIHQTYARNLANLAEWSFIPGTVSGGSTSPLWTILLTIGHWLHQFILWTFLLGVTCQIALAITGMKLFQKFSTEPSNVFALCFGLFLVTEWHIQWAAMSGMETIFYILLILLFFAALQNSATRWISGVIVGIAVWVRPDGILLLGPLLWVTVLDIMPARQKASILIKCIIGLSVIVGGYLLFTHSISGNWWPNTFYAKQMEYVATKEIPVLSRMISLLFLPWIGSSILLIPGFLFEIVDIVRKRKIVQSAAVLWALGFILIYVIRLSVTYQHGRYIMPVMPVLFLIGFLGYQKLIYKLLSKVNWQRILKTTWQMSLLIATIAFISIGSIAYGRDVAIINTEMVAMSKWVEENTEVNSTIAAHDIGALGFFGQREIIDLAGLISPDVIPIIRDEVRLEAYLDEKNVDYLMTFPDWYPFLVTRAEKIYSTNGVYSPAAGGENMVLYKWSK